MFDDILADCIVALEQGATIEECLTRHPAHAAALEPLLRLVVSLSRESKTRMSSHAFAQGRSALLARAQQQRTQADSRTAQHRHFPAQAPAQPKRQVHRSPYPQNGALQQRRSLVAKRSWWSLGIPRLLITTILIMAVVGVTTISRHILSSLPGTLLYPLKSAGEQVAGVLMVAAGEEINWHAAQAERRLQELVHLPPSEVAAGQRLSNAVEKHWRAVLTASQRLPADERATVLQTHISRLQQVEVGWTTHQVVAPLAAVQTVRRMITAGEQALTEPQPTATVRLETVATETGTSVTSTATPTIQSTATATPLLQVTATAPTTLPVLVPSATPTQIPTESLPAPVTATVTPTLPTPPIPMPTATPMPEITGNIPLQDSTDNKRKEETSNKDEDQAAESEAPTPVPPTNEAEELTPGEPEMTATPDNVDSVQTVEPVSTIETTPISEQPTATGESGTPQAVTTVEVTPLMPTKTTTPATTSEVAPTGTPRPTSQPAATKTPKPTATTSTDNNATPPTTVATTAVAATAPAPTQPVAEPVETPIPAITPIFAQPLTPRPTSSGGEATRTARP